MGTILIADDNKQISSVLAEYAKKEGYTPVLTENGKEAIEKFHDTNPDIILLDVMMPLD